MIFQYYSLLHQRKQSSDIPMMQDFETHLWSEIAIQKLTWQDLCTILPFGKRT